MRRAEKRRNSPGIEMVFLHILRTLTNAEKIYSDIPFHIDVQSFLAWYSRAGLPRDITLWPEFALLARRLAERFAGMKGRRPAIVNNVKALNAWADSLDRAIAARARQQTKDRARPPTRIVAKRAAEKGSHGGKRA